MSDKIRDAVQHLVVDALTAADLVRSGHRSKALSDRLSQHCSVLSKMLAAAPAAPVAQEPHTFWVLFDAAAEQRFIKKMLPEGFLAFFDCERDARLAKARNPGTDYKRVDYYAAPPAAEQPDTVPVPREQLEQLLDRVAHREDPDKIANELCSILLGKEGEK